MGTPTFMMANLDVIIGGLGLVTVILLCFTLSLYFSLSDLKQRYRQMMSGAHGEDIETMLRDHVRELERMREKDIDLEKELERQGNVLLNAITKVGIVRFCAFAEMGGDLSYAVALLNNKDDGVVLSSIFGREDSCTYAKPIRGGRSDYQLTQEENQALKEAMGKCIKK